jgi:hypothetical protein
LNDGSGGFGTHVDSAVGAASLVGDLNGDGKADAVVSGGEDILRVALNDGSGTVVASGDYWQPLLQGQTLGDVDGDGKPDLVTASYFDTVNVRLNRGDGTFGAVRNIFSPYPIVFVVAAGDLNGDGKADLATLVNADDRYAVTVSLNQNTSKTATGVTMMQSSPHTQNREAVTFTARVWPEGGGAVTGRVRFVVDGVTLASVPVKDGVAQWQTSSLSETLWPPERRYHTVMAVYDGDGRLAGSSSERVTHTVSGPPRANFHVPTGGVGLLNRSVATGWALDADTAARPVEVQVVVDGRYVGSAVANGWRLGHPGHGFTFVMPTLGTGRHVVRVFGVDTRTGVATLLGARIVAG